MNSPLTQLLGIEYPLFQAPIGSVAGVDLAAAVSTAGGLGALALTWTSAEKAKALVVGVKRKTDRPFQVNFVLAFEPKALPKALESGAPIVTFSWGMPVNHVSLVRSFGARLGIQVTTAEGARQALDLGADFLICQGVEAGGHVQATRSLWDVLPKVVAEAAGAPVVAAGGIATGVQIHNALEAGAAGAMLGTRFVATRESLAHDLYKEPLLSASGNEAVLTVCFDGGWPHATHRALRTSTLEKWETSGCPSPGNRPGEGQVVAHHVDGHPCIRYDDTSPLNGMTGNVQDLCYYAGTGCGSINDLPDASALVIRLWEEAQKQASLKKTE